MDRGQENTEGDVGSSNEEVPRVEVQQPEENDTKPLVNDVSFPECSALS